MGFVSESQCVTVSLVESAPVNLRKRKSAFPTKNGGRQTASVNLCEILIGDSFAKIKVSRCLLQ